MYSGIRQQLEAEKENHRDQVNELEEKVFLNKFSHKKLLLFSFQPSE